MKRIVFCFDGTWNKLDSKNPTNVVLMSESILPFDDNTAQITYYDEGVGTTKGERWRGGVFGAGLIENVADAYRFLVFNYHPGDEIFIFGFSRGAYTARSFAGLLKNVGILHRTHVRRIGQAIKLYRNRKNSATSRALDMNEFAPLRASDDTLTIKYLGIWDTVGALGIPKNLSLSSLTNRKHQFHDTDLSPMVLSARHAIAIDERRRSFEPTLWTNLEELNTQAGKSVSAKDAPYQQQWFPGTHGSVGGGGDIRGLSNAALAWIMFGAIQAGLQITTKRMTGIDEFSADPFAPLSNMLEKKGISLSGWAGKLMARRDRIPGAQSITEVSDAANARWSATAENLPEGKLYRPAPLSSLAKLLSQRL